MAMAIMKNFDCAEDTSAFGEVKIDDPIVVSRP